MNIRCTDAEIIVVAKSSNSVSEVMRKLGFGRGGNTHRHFKNRLLKLGIVYTKSQWLKLPPGKKRDIKDYLVVNGPYIDSSTLRRKLISSGLMQNICDKCKNNGSWCGERLGLQLDHINGDNNDNRLCNLRILCPNCHSQTITHSKQKGYSTNYCSKCNTKLRKKSLTGYCADCYEPESKIPSREILADMIWVVPTTKIAKLYGVSDKAVTKWCKKYRISKPGPGYWMKIKSAKASVV